ncbi:hypothetical protein [Rickettsia honei]|uniref:hypothetical protein n=1 Tax=Rickettsia honei TaxID=37816 RepID=UPI0003090D8D|nr:hypothetical protein [Rickettsia honei]
MNKLIKNFIKTKKYDEIKSILASKNSYNLLGLHHAITSFYPEAYKLIISYANPSHFTSAEYDRYIHNIDDTSMLDVAAILILYNIEIQKATCCKSCLSLRRERLRSTITMQLVNLK